ncbi:DUF3141 domain-containing protein [Variovorax dokdonensis]|uniref:DUF3141 domain-containing protein n=1 Tax=Variovorax dokdonensis TaxID=344883 RepID=A0ABT7NCR9_9BURK|nr:DUF3141 domain-containing protein [Variovorax dokdonensis]MDM0045734.1 DUF3141 domain-containing protein [Variovorax dokdonensis]
MNDTTAKTPFVSLADAVHAMQALPDYLVDAWQRGVLTADVLRERGDIFLAHALNGKPPLLTFEHELLMDGRDLPQPCNYALLRIVPPAGAVIDPAKRPIVIIDPRAGHGPGIGGFKPDSEVGVALRAGHAVYFVSFAPEPVDGQRLVDVARAEATFIEEVTRRHPQCPQKPAVIGNCQAGWAVAALASVRGEAMGPIVLNGAPLSYWAGSPSQNPMRYAGGMLGGSWLSAFTADLSGDRFDGAWLVSNFENLNLGNTLWGKLYNLYANVDTERERFLEFERWWGGYFRMTGEEIEAIVENLFVGNRLARGELAMDGVPINLRNIASPVVVFASWGDNITPPQQALDWILDVWGTEKALIAAGRTIVYMLHPTIGHLGIFVGGAVARKEHDQLLNTLDQIEALPPGLYEMKILPGDADDAFAHLETGGWRVRFETRTTDDIRALNPEKRQDETLFSTIAQWSELNMQAYRTWAQPFVRSVGSRALGDAMRWLHPLRMQHLALSDLNPMAPWVRAGAQRARNERKPAAGDNPWLAWEHQASSRFVEALDTLGQWRDQASVEWVEKAYGPMALGAVLPPEQADEMAALQRAGKDEARARRLALENVDKGGFAEAVCRLVFAGIVNSGAVERRGLRLARRLADLHAQMATHLGLLHAQTHDVDWQRTLDAQALITTFAPEASLESLPKLLPHRAEREHALALAAAVLMAEPRLSDPKSPVSRFVRDKLDVDPARVAAMALSLAQTAAQEDTDAAGAEVAGISLPAPKPPAAKKAPRRPTKPAARPTAKRTAKPTAKSAAKPKAKAAAPRKRKPAAKTQRELRLVVNR